MAAGAERKAINIVWVTLSVAAVLLISSRIANRPVTSVRGPLKILTPPITADKAAIIQQLSNRKFQNLDTQLNGYQKACDANIAEEANLQIAFDSFNFTDPALGPILDEWVKAEPTSYPAHLARARYRAALGLQARGHRYVNETSEQQLNEMSDRLSEGVQEALTAIKLNPKSSIAYALIIDAAKYEGDRKGLSQVYAAGIKSVPLSYAIRVTTINALQPKWLGTYDMMERFANDAQKYAGQNPRLVGLRGFADVERGNIAWQNKDLKSAIRLFNKALDEGGDFSQAYYSRGNAYAALHRDDDALEDLNRANRISPQNSDTLAALAYVYESLDRPKDAMAVIEQSRQFTQLNPYTLNIERWAQNFLAGNTEAIKTGGN